jgi:hypothetical protein
MMIGFVPIPAAAWIVIQPEARKKGNLLNL